MGSKSVDNYFFLLVRVQYIFKDHFYKQCFMYHHLWNSAFSPLGPPTSTSRASTPNPARVDQKIKIGTFFHAKFYGEQDCILGLFQNFHSWGSKCDSEVPLIIFGQLCVDGNRPYGLNFGPNLNVSIDSRSWYIWLLMYQVLVDNSTNQRNDCPPKFNLVKSTKSG